MALGSSSSCAASEAAAAAAGSGAAAPAAPPAVGASHKLAVDGEGLLAPALLPALGFPLPSSASRPEEMRTAAGAGGWARTARAAEIADIRAKHRDDQDPNTVHPQLRRRGGGGSGASTWPWTSPLACNHAPKMVSLCRFGAPSEEGLGARAKRNSMPHKGPCAGYVGC